MDKRMLRIIGTILVETGKPLSEVLTKIADAVDTTKPQAKIVTIQVTQEEAKGLLVLFQIINTGLEVLEEKMKENDKVTPSNIL